MSLRIYDAEYGEHTIYMALSKRALQARYGDMANFIADVADRYGVDLEDEGAQEAIQTILSDNSVPLTEEHPYAVVRQGSTVADSRISQAAFRAFAGGKGESEEEGAQGEEDPEDAKDAKDEGIDITTPVLIQSIKDAGGDWRLCKKKLTHAYRWPRWKTLSVDKRREMIAELPVDDAQELWNASLAGGQLGEDDLGNWIAQSRSSPLPTTGSTAPPVPSPQSSRDTAREESHEASESSIERRSRPGRRRRRRRIKKKSAPS